LCFPQQLNFSTCLPNTSVEELRISSTENVPAIIELTMSPRWPSLDRKEKAQGRI
jgi:hypothetical protein